MDSIEFKFDWNFNEKELLIRFKSEEEIKGFLESFEEFLASQNEGGYEYVGFKK